jgi:hypothetical protein
LLLIHQIPPKPNYLRVKVGRRLQRIGAMALKNTVYVLPWTDAALEDFQWVRQEIVEGGGDATIVDGQLVDGLTDREVEALFREARDADYAEVANEARRVADDLPPAPLDEDRRRTLETEIGRLERWLDEITSIDFFAAAGREAAAGLVAGLRARSEPPRDAVRMRSPSSAGASYRRRTWVTRAGVHVDRIASAWLIRHFIDTEATFKFVPARGYVPEPGELRFDMFEAEFSHEGDLCTFEVLVRRMGLSQPGLRGVAEVVHDIDLKDGKFGRLETAGVAALIAGLALLHRDDEARLARGFELFDELFAFYAKRKDMGKEP